MNVSLTPELEELIDQKVKSGFYNSASEVVREALRLLREQDTLKALRFEELKREIQRGIEEADQGEVAPLNIEEIKAKGRQQLNRLNRREQV